MINQVIANGLIAASVYLLVALGFGLIYSTTRFFHFAHGAMIAAGPYAAFFFVQRMGLSLPLALVMGIGVATFLGCLIEGFVYRPLKRSGSGPLILLLASLGLYIVLQNLISVTFGDDAKSLQLAAWQRGLTILGVNLTGVQMMMICTSLICAVGLAFAVQGTTLGRQIRAVANDSELASVVGMKTNHVRIWVFALGSMLAGIAGVMMALNVQMTPTMGMAALLGGVVVVIIGGSGSILGIVLGALLLGLAQNFGVWFLSSRWQDAITFIILLIFLLFRPQGFCGSPLKKTLV